MGAERTIEAECMDCGKMQQVDADREIVSEWDDRDETGDSLEFLTISEGQVCEACGSDDLKDPDDYGDAPSWRSEREDFHSDG